MDPRPHLDPTSWHKWTVVRRLQAGCTIAATAGHDAGPCPCLARCDEGVACTLPAEEGGQQQAPGAPAGIRSYQSARILGKHPASAFPQASRGADATSSRDVQNPGVRPPSQLHVTECYERCTSNRRLDCAQNTISVRVPYHTDVSAHSSRRKPTGVRLCDTS